MSKRFYMPWNGADFRRDTAELSTDAELCYRRLLEFMFERGGKLRNDAKVLAALGRVRGSNWTRVWGEISHYFTVAIDGDLTQKHVSNDLSEIESRSAAKRQFALEREERKRNQNNGKISPDCQDEALTKTKTKTEEEIEKDTLASIPKDKRGTRLPDEFDPDETCQSVATQLGLTDRQAQIELNKFTDYWRAVPAAKGRKLDWQATFRNWLRNSNTKGISNGHAQQEPTLSHRQAHLAKLKQRAIDAKLREIGESGDSGGSDIQGQAGDADGKPGLPGWPH